MSTLFEKYASSNEAAERLGIHQNALQKLLQKGTLKADKFANRWMISREALEHFAKSYRGSRGRPRKGKVSQ
jgi:excisionase family DNA binding protein